MGILDVVLFIIVAFCTVKVLSFLGSIINYCIAFIYAKIHRKKHF